MNILKILWSLVFILTIASVLQAEDTFVAVDKQAKTLFEKAISEFKEGNLEGSFSHAMSAWRKDRAILSLNDQGIMRGFEKYLKGKITQSPEDATDYYRLAKLQAVRGLPQKAKFLLEKVCELAPDTDLARKAQVLIRALEASLAEQKLLAADREQFEKESRKKSTLENIKLRNRELAAENSRLKDKTAKAEKTTQAKEIAAKDAQIKKLEEQAEKNTLYSTLFWANPTNAYLMKKNYDKERIAADLADKWPTTEPNPYK